MSVRVDMAPHSGVIVYDFLDHAYPVVGWVTYQAESGTIVVYPMILNQGKLEGLNDEKLAYDVVGNLTPRWAEVVGYHNATVPQE